MFRFVVINKKVLVVFLLLIGIFVLLSPEIKENPRYYLFEKPFASTVNLIHSGFSLIFRGISTTWNNYIDLVDVKEENQRLFEEGKRLRTESLSLKEKALAYDRLTQLLKVKDAIHTEFTVATIVAREPTNWYSAVVINRGEEDGIRPNMGVITAEGIVGKITKTAPHHSRVLLFSDRNSAVGGMIQRTRDEGIVTGGEGKVLRLNYILIESDIRKGDLVLTSGTDSVFPPGVVIGRISRVESPQNALFHSIELIPEVSPSKIREVMVLNIPQPPEVEMLLKEEVR
ncbi:MAG: rod shape-determining protein MreC [Nitrospirae bacterium]|nr:rod shape-determining protein MreC [Nitrospirota bacterium]